MKQGFKAVTSIGLAKETESPENPGALEKRVALIPEHIKRLVDRGFNIFVEHGAGESIGFPDSEYQASGAVMESNDSIYKNKNMMIKLVV
ncbi:MAG TPA: alanine dehydrogenase, partial [Flavobacteriales bacterium]|nr:alanine dehydrogenase [Flavobacteriales bacterium]